MTLVSEKVWFPSTSGPRLAGLIDPFEDVFDAATGDYITTNVSFQGPHLGAEGVDICGASVAYLLDP